MCIWRKSTGSFPITILDFFILQCYMNVCQIFKLHSLYSCPRFNGHTFFPSLQGLCKYQHYHVFHMVSFLLLIVIAIFGFTLIIPA